MKSLLLLKTALLFIFLNINQVSAANTTQQFNDAFKNYHNFITQGKYLDALPYAQKSYQLSKEHFDSLDDNRLTAADNYALTLKAVDKLSLSRTIFLELLALSDNKYGEHAKVLLPLLADINALNKQLEDIVDAEEAKALAVRQYKLYLRHYSDDVVSQFVDQKLLTTQHAKNTQQKVSKHLDKQFDIYETKHWSIIYPVNNLKFVKQKMSKLMEKTYTNNLSFLVSLGLRSKPVEEKMTAVYFNSKDDYKSYVKTITHDEYGASNSGSLYSPKARSIFVYGRGKNKKGKEKHVSTKSLIHIVSDQVFDVTGFRAKRIYPRWFTKGISVSFEPHNFKQSFGPHTSNYSFKRVLAIKKQVQDNSLVSIKRLITLDGDDEAFENVENQRNVYSVGHLLFRFIYTYYPDELKDYLVIIAKTRIGQYGKNVRLKQFTKAFGAPEELQDKFTIFTKNIIEETDELYAQYKKRKADNKKKGQR